MEKKTIRTAVINDLSGLGRCSLTADIAVLSAMGIQACPMPTAILSAQTGFPAYSFLDMKSEMSSYIRKWKELDVRFDGILTGFLTGDEEASLVQSFLREFRTENTKLLVDPVMADGGRGYANFTTGLRRNLRALAGEADVVTPNVTELFFLADLPCREKDLLSPDPAELADLARSMMDRSGQLWVVTGLPFRDQIGNLLVTEQAEELISSPRYGKNFSGSGDLLAASLFGSLLLGVKPREAIEMTNAFISAAASSAVHKNFQSNDGLDFEPYLSMLNGGNYYEKESED